MGRIPMTEERYKEELEGIVKLAYEKEVKGFEKFGEGINENFDTLQEIREEIADTINYLVMGLIKMRYITRRMEEQEEVCKEGR